MSKETLDLLLELAGEADINDDIEKRFSGDKINETENRAVLHTALRNLDGGPIMVDGVDVMPGVLNTLQRMRDFADDVRNGGVLGAGGVITDVVNIGIGGSDLGSVP